MREEFDHRPLVAVFLGLAIGSSAFLNPYIGLFALPLFLILKRWSVRAAALCACLAGFTLYPRLDQTLVTEDVFFEGEVDVLTMPVSTGDRLRAVVGSGDRRYVLYLPESSGVVLGDRVKVRADLSPFREGQVESRGAIGTMSAISSPTLIEGGSFVWRAGLWVRRSFRDMTFRFAYKETGPLLDGMCFSMTSEIPVEFRQAMSKTGTTHIVSTSGLHVVLATFALAFVIGVFPVPRWAQIAFLFALLAVYAGAAGLQPPMLRAVLMMMVFFCAYMVRRGTDGLSALGLAGALSLLWAPELVLDIGFQLSMVAVGSLVLFARVPDAEEFDVKEWALRYVESSVVVTLATAPLLAYHFGIVPLMSIPANLLVIPVLGVVIAGALAAWVLWLAVPAVGVGLLKVSVEPVTGWVGLSIERLGSLPFASFAVPEFSAYWLLPIYIAAIAVWRPYVRTV